MSEKTELEIAPTLTRMEAGMLVAAAAERIAAGRSGDKYPAPLALQTAMLKLRAALKASEGPELDVPF